MRAVLTSLVFLAGLAAVVLVHAPRAHAAWERPQRMDAGSSPSVRVEQEALFVAYAKGDARDPSALLVGEGNEPMRRVRVPRAGRVVAFDIDVSGQLVALRETRRRLIALEGRRWRAISAPDARAVDAKLAVAASGAAVAAWLRYVGSRVVVYAALRAPGATRFGAPQRLSRATARAGQALTVAVDEAGEAAVTFSEGGDLWMWRPSGAFKVHDRTATVAGAFTAAAAVRGPSALVAFTHPVDPEAPEYRLSAALASGDGAPVVETVAEDVSALDVATAFAADGAPLVLGSPIGEPHSLRLSGRSGSWAERAAIPTTDAASTVRLHDGGACVTWTVGTRGYASTRGQTLSLGRAYDVDCAIGAGGRALAVWDRGPGRAMGIARFTP